MNNEENDFPSEDENAQQSSNIPPPDTSNTQDTGSDADTDTGGEDSAEQVMLDDLKNRASQLGIKFHPSIKAEKLREKIQAALDENTAQANEQPIAESVGGANTSKNEKHAQLKKDQLKLIRVRITCMDPMKKAYEGDFFLTGNSLVGTVKRFVPFGVEWHVPQIILNMIQAKKYQQFSTSKNSKNVDITTSKLVPTYAVEILEALTEKDIKELAQRQAMAKGQASD